MSKNPTFTEFFDGMARSLKAVDSELQLERTPIVEYMSKQLEKNEQMFFSIAPRRCGKSMMAGLICLYKMMTKKGSYSVWVAPSEKQSSTIALQALKKYSCVIPELAFYRHRISYGDSELDILSSSEASAAGRKIDGVMVCDEIASPSFTQDLFQILLPSTMHGGCTIGITSPGSPRHWVKRYIDSGKFPVESFKQPEKFQHLDFDFINNQKEIAEGSEYLELQFKRQYSGEWLEIKGASFVPLRAIKRCSVQTVEPYDRKLDRCTVGVDIGIRRDLTSIVLIAERWEDRPVYRVLEIEYYEPTSFPDGKTDVAFITERIKRLSRAYNADVVLDAHQAEGIAQDLKRANLTVLSQVITNNLNEEGYGFLSRLIRQDDIRWKNHERLESELMGLIVDETPSGRFKFVDAEKRIHHDVCAALMLAVWKSNQSGYQGLISEPSYDPQENTSDEDGPDLWDSYWRLRAQNESEEVEHNRLMELSQNTLSTFWRT